MQDKIKQINDSLKEIRTAISNQGVVIPDDTPLSEYASRISEISRPTITIGQQVFVFYCNAKDNEELERKNRPSVSWNNEFNAWDVTETIGGWTQAVPNPETDKYLYGLIVSVTPGQSTSDEGFSWPRPIPIQGKNGEPGEKGDTGRDGVLVGATSYHTTLVYHKITESETVDSVQISKDNIQYHVDSNDPFGPESIKVNDELIINPESYWTTVLDPSSLTVCAIITYSVMSKASEYIGKIDAVSEPFVLFGEQVKEQIVEYAINNNRDTVPSEWESTPGILTTDNQYLWSRITTVYAVGDTKVSDPVIISQYPKSIVSIDVKYGVSSDINTVPDDWESTYDQYENYTILWSKEITYYSDGTSSDVIKPTGFKGDPGISPITVLATMALDEVYTWTLAHTDIEMQSAIIVDGQTYVWNGTNNPSTFTDNYYIVTDGSTTYYWINLGQWFSTKSDWNVHSENELGHIANRTHYNNYVTLSGTYTIEEKNEFLAHIVVPLPEASINESVTTTLLNVNSDWCNFVEKTTSQLKYSFDEYVVTIDTSPVVQNEYLSFFVYCKDDNGSSIPSKIFGKELSCTFQLNYFKSLDPKFVSQMIDVNYDYLKWLKDNNRLIPGMQYRITDYDTITVQENTRSTYHPFDIIVTANSENSLNCKARAIHSDRDTESYFVDNDLSKWELWYDLDDRWRYDWIPNQDIPMGVTLSTGENCAVIDYTPHQFVDLSAIDDYYSEPIYSDYILLDHPSIVIKHPSTLDKTEYNKKFSIFGYGLFSSTDRTYSDNFWSIISAMYITDNEIKLKTLVPGRQYTIRLNESYDSVLWNLSPAAITSRLVEEKTYPVYTDSGVVTQFRETFITQILKYCAKNTEYSITALENMVELRSTWTAKHVFYIKEYISGPCNVAWPSDQQYLMFNESELRHKGTIYRMIDEWGNDCPYDFKNIQFLNTHDYNEPYGYTFNSIQSIKQNILFESYADLLI